MVSWVFRLATSWVGWRVIPNLVSSQALALFYTYFYSRVLGRQIPRADSSEYQRHRRLLYMLVVFGYALWTFHDAATSIGANYYELLGVNPTADEGDLKLGFRAFARRYHPDRAGPQTETLFMEVRDAYEALKDPLTRFAYDRFGPSALTWTQCKTMQEYVSHGLTQSLIYHAVGFCSLFIWNKIAPRNVTFWNYLLVFATFAYELWFILGPSPIEPSNSALPDFLFADPASPSHNGLLNFLWPTRVAYQHVTFLKSLTLLLTAALHQVIPTIFPSSVATLEQHHYLEIISALTNSAKSAELEVFRTIQADLHSCTDGLGDSTLVSPDFAEPSLVTPTTDMVEKLQREVQTGLLDSLLWSQSGPIRSACEAAVRASRRQAAAAVTYAVDAGELRGRSAAATFRRRREQWLADGRQASIQGRAKSMSY